MLFVLCSSSCCKDNPRIRRSTSVSNGRVRQSCFVILERFNTPLPGRDPVLRRSRVSDLSRRFGVASAILRLAAPCVLVSLSLVLLPFWDLSSSLALLLILALSLILAMSLGVLGMLMYSKLLLTRPFAVVCMIL